MENLKLKKHHKLVIAADGSAASGKTTGAKKISKKYGLKFLSSGLLYRFASHQILEHRPKNKIVFLKKKFRKLNLKKLNSMNVTNTCPTCLSKPVNIYLNPCGHTLCDDCYDRISYDNERKCFLCRTRVMNKSPLYFS